MNNAYDKLRQRKQSLKNQFGDRFNRLDRIASLVIDDVLVSEIESCLYSDNELYINEGMNFLKGLMIGRNVSALPEDFLKRFVAVLPSMIKSRKKFIVYSALEWFVTFRESYPEYREIMLSFLKSEDAGERKLSLKYYDTYAHAGEYEPLLSFEHDTYACQMGHAGDWEYELRDKAFMLIEAHLHSHVPKVKCKEPFEGAEISWFDWGFLGIY